MRIKGSAKRKIMINENDPKNTTVANISISRLNCKKNNSDVSSKNFLKEISLSRNFKHKSTKRGIRKTRKNGSSPSNCPNSYEENP